MRKNKKVNGSSTSIMEIPSIKINGITSSPVALSAISNVPKTKKEKKIKYDLLLNQLKNKVFLKENQLELSKKIEENIITLITGPAGTSKTYSSCYTLLKLLFESKIDKIIFSKPIKESGESLGYLPGDIDQKIGPYMESFVDTCTKLVGIEVVTFLLENKLIEHKPMAYMRGVTFDNSGIFLDEAQNATVEQLMLLITRFGTNSKLVIAGDVTQRDIEKKKVVFPEIITMLSGLQSVSTHEFRREDIVRHPLLIQITEKYEEWKDKKGI